MDLIGSLDFFTGVDFIICLVVGAFAGWLAGPFMKGGGFGLIGNIVIGIVGAVIGGYAFDVVNIIDLGDLLDPLIAALVGAAILLAIAGAIPRQTIPRQQG